MAPPAGSFDATSPGFENYPPSQRVSGRRAPLPPLHPVDRSARTERIEQPTERFASPAAEETRRDGRPRG
ncbi:hypothetical protein GS415_10850 [Rhodococcus hoagii]|nr:hypothetical protein [Prescottella equi]